MYGSPRLIRVIDIDTQSHAHALLCEFCACYSGEKENKRKYVQAAQACHASFSPFVLSVDGLMALEACFVVQWFARALSTKWSKSYGEVMGWVKTRLSFAILQATN